MKKFFYILIIAAVSIVCLNDADYCVSEAQTPSAVKLEQIAAISKKDNILIFAPHPDDETLSCAGVIQRAKQVGAKLNVVYLTNGDSNQLAFIVYEKRIVFRKGAFLHMGEVRRKESIAAMKLLGVPQENLIFLGYPDFGTMAVFKNYWKSKRPFISLLTRAKSVPYPEDFSYGKPYRAESILGDVKEILKKVKPTKIFVTSPVDTNGDHRSMYLFLKLALLDLGEQFTKNIKLYLYLVHHYHWPKPRHYHPDLSLPPPADMQKSDYAWYGFDLTSQEIKNKHSALLKYKSQTESSAFYLLSFVRKNELFFGVSDVVLKGGSLDGQLNWSNRFDTLVVKEKEDDSESAGDLIDNSAVSFARKDKDFLIKITPSKQPFITSLSIYLFGYKKQVEFPLMPKIRLKITGNTVSAFDGRRKLEGVNASIRKEDKEIIVTFPLKALNDPELIFCSVNISLRGLPYDSNAWRVINLK